MSNFAKFKNASLNTLATFAIGMGIEILRTDLLAGIVSVAIGVVLYFAKDHLRTKKKK